MHRPSSTLCSAHRGLSRSARSYRALAGRDKLKWQKAESGLVIDAHTELKATQQSRRDVLLAPFFSRTFLRAAGDIVANGLAIVRWKHEQITESSVVLAELCGDCVRDARGVGTRRRHRTSGDDRSEPVRVARHESALQDYGALRRAIRWVPRAVTVAGTVSGTRPCRPSRPEEDSTCPVVPAADCGVHPSGAFPACATFGQTTKCKQLRSETKRHHSVPIRADLRQRSTHPVSKLAHRSNI